MCRLTAERPSSRYGLLDETVAWDFDAAAAVVLEIATAERENKLALLSGGYGTGEPDADPNVEYW